MFKAEKIRGRWVVVDTVANVHYFPPKQFGPGAVYPFPKIKGKDWAQKKARELNTGK